MLDSNIETLLLLFQCDLTVGQKNVMSYLKVLLFQVQAGNYMHATKKAINIQCPAIGLRIYEHILYLSST